MSSNQEILVEQYRLQNEDGRAGLTRSSGLEFHYTKKHLEGLIKSTDCVLEVGCATGYYGLYYADQCREYRGLDLIPEHIRLFRQKIADSGRTNLSCQVGDATCLNGLGDESFDVVLCLGPLYHLPPVEREAVFAESARVCKTGGIAAFAYINQVGVYMGGCLLDSRYPNEEANRCVLENGTDDLRPELFFYTMPEEMEAVAARYGFRKIKNVGTDFMIAMQLVNAMSEEQFDQMLPLYDRMACCESCTGMANHALLVCRK